MTTKPHRMPLGRLAKATIALEGLLGLGAIAGGSVLIVARRDHAPAAVGA